MQRQNLRVMVASEYPEVRRLFKEVAEIESGTAIIGEAENTIMALDIVRNIKPDIAVIDFNLPQTVGLDSTRLSRMGGLDAAQTIGERFSKTLVVLVTGSDTNIPAENCHKEFYPQFFRPKIEGNIPFTLQELYQSMVKLEMPIFASIKFALCDGSERRIYISKNPHSFFDWAVSFGALGIVAGLALFATVLLAPAGAFLALAGGIAIVLGFGGKLISRLFARVSQ